MSRPCFFAVWTDRCAYSLDVYSDEIDRYCRGMIRHGERFAGPFETADEAHAVALRRLRERATA